ncbi:MAG: hypothetical protein EOL88_10515 [Bacteroidia bacterium]|nr:hypothetical protein [Bacteroidales bacterium]NCD42513.1 hypothetical protein [Bacteroidia bacterium]MDD3010701.1 hypothetical protein [Bacteroidales bacterium]MDD3962672.1 hypothetical protein [Bacteroidales bacterium]MDY0285139.1 hypothetical protein [Bacteroidales bacterium]
MNKQVKSAKGNPEKRRATLAVTNEKRKEWFSYLFQNEYFLGYRSGEIVKAIADMYFTSEGTVFRTIDTRELQREVKSGQFLPDKDYNSIIQN